MPNQFLVDGVDLATATGFEFYHGQLPEFYEGPALDYAETTVLQSAGIYLAGEVTVAPRRGKLTGLVAPAAGTVTAGVAAVRNLKDLLYGGARTFTFIDAASNTRVLRDVVVTQAKIDVQPARQHWQSLKVARAEIAFLAPSPFFEKPEFSLRALATTRRTLVLGTAPCWWRVRIFGAATDPHLIYRAPDGTVLWDLGFTKTLNATNDELELDARRGRIWSYASGTRSDGIALLTSGQADWPRPFDPRDGDGLSGQWPLLEVSAGAGLAEWWEADL